VREKSINSSDFIGKVFGRLTVTECSEKRGKRGEILWKCFCSCGNAAEVPQTDLLRGNTVSCGCKKRENNQNIYRQLRLVDGTCIDFLEKRKTRKDNRTGKIGVSLYGERYRANITLQGKRYYLGTFDSLEEAVEERKRAEEELHGAFLKAYYDRKKEEQSEARAIASGK